MQPKEALKKSYKELDEYKKEREKIGQDQIKTAKKLSKLKEEVEAYEKVMAQLAAEKMAMEMKIDNKFNEIQDILKINFTAPE